MTEKQSPTSAVNIGSVTGGINNSQIAGRDLISPAAVDPSPQRTTTATIQEITALLQSIQKDLSSLSAQKALLATISESAVTQVQEAHDSVSAVIPKVATDASPETRASVISKISDAESSISKLVGNAADILSRTGRLAHSGSSLLALLPNLQEHLSQALQWISGLWS